MDQAATTLVSQELTGSMTPSDAFERICLAIIAIEAIANAANAAIDVCSPPPEDSAPFDRAQALVGQTAEMAAAGVALVRELRASVRAHLAGRR